MQYILNVVIKKLISAVLKQEQVMKLKQDSLDVLNANILGESILDSN